MGINPDLKPGVQHELGRLQFWENRHGTRRGEAVAVGDRVRYKDYKHAGVVTELLDGIEGRRDLVGRAGAKVSFNGRAAVPVFLWALQLEREPDAK